MGPLCTSNALMAQSNVRLPSLPLYLITIFLPKQLWGLKIKSMGCGMGMGLEYVDTSFC